MLNFNFETVIKQSFDVADQVCRQMDVEVDSDAVCKRYVTNKKLIQEFNLGISGRYKTVLTTDEEGLCDDIFKPFLDRYINI